ncbi:MAG: 16S rRNA (cytosine(967)-C(5))-methyltransferase RsmB [Betaproteobacteria bacterium]
MTAVQEPTALWRQLQATASVIAAVRKGASGTAALDAVPSGLRPGVQSLAFYVWRNLGRAQSLRSALVSRAPAPAIDALLCVALALLWNPGESPYDAFTLVNQAVEALKRNPQSRAQANFVNACLRRFLRERAQLLATTDGDLEALWNYPRWWIERVRRDHPQHWQTVLRAGNAHAPMTLRVHARHCSAHDYVLRLQSVGIAARQGEGAAVMLERPVPVTQLPGFGDGWVAVQDAAAQSAAPLLLQGLGQRPRILDACAAPGGKTAHLLEASDASVVALEIDGARLHRIQDNLQRLGLQAQVIQGDAARPQDWWDGALFDGILLDAPCTASGIVRRHPDIRWLRRESDSGQLAALQSQILQSLWPLLRTGGHMVYCTCSIFRVEGEQQIQNFLARHTDARLCPSPGHLLPGGGAADGAVYDNSSHDHDGFYYALLEKNAA